MLPGLHCPAAQTAHNEWEATPANTSHHHLLLYASPLSINTANSTLQECKELHFMQQSEGLRHVGTFLGEVLERKQDEVSCRHLGGEGSGREFHIQEDLDRPLCILLASNLHVLWWIKPPKTDSLFSTMHEQFRPCSGCSVRCIQPAEHIIQCSRLACIRSLMSGDDSASGSSATPASAAKFSDTLCTHTQHCELSAASPC